MKTKILHIIDGMTNRGGTEAVYMNIFRNIERTEFQFDFLCMSKGEHVYAQEIYSLGGKIFYLPSNRISRSKYFKLFFWRASIRKFLKNNEYDVVHIHWDSAVSYFLAKGALDAGIKKVIVHSHNSFAAHKTVHNFFKKRLSNLPIIKLACSDDAGGWLFHSKNGNKDYKVIYNGINQKDYRFNMESRVSLRKEFGINDDATVIGHVGRFELQKNHSFLIDVFCEYAKKNANSILLLIGVGHLQNGISEKVKQLNLENQVKMLGARDNVKELLNAMDVFLFPSLFEGLSVVSVEVQSNYLPLVQSSHLSPLSVISNKVKNISLDDSLEKWVNAIDIAKSQRFEETIFNENYKKFDIIYTVEELSKIYFQV